MNRISILSLVLLLLTSCEKESPAAIDKILLLGTWLKIEASPYKTCNSYIEFNETGYRVKTICENSSITSSFIEYKIEGTKIMVEETKEYDILYLSDSLLKMRDVTGTLLEYRKP